MVQKTDLNVAPYYDDFDSSKNYVKSLFRPGFAIQARELTQLQSALQNQVARFGEHIFKEGSIVIPGAVSVFRNYHSLKLASTFASETINPAQYYNATTPVIITGATSGVTAQVVGYDVASTTDQPTLFLKYIKTGTDGEENAFLDGENISANAGITHTTSYSSSIASATTYTSSFSDTDSTVTFAQFRSSTGPAAAAGVAVDVQAGVYFIRGHFVECLEERIVISKYDPVVNFRCGFAITETLVTPEDQSSLLDNATGSSNFAAKGAHRLQISLALKKLDYDATTDSNFVELVAFKNGWTQSTTRDTEYNILEENLARRTYDESGDYTVRPFQIIMKENTTLNENVGVYISGDTTDDGNISSNALLACQISTGKAYVKGYEIEKIAPTFKDINKARDVENVNAGITTFDLGNYTVINNVYGTPDITAISGESTAYKTISLYDHFITTDGSVPVSGGLSPEPIGQARARAIEYDSGTIGTDDARYKIYLFDIKMFTFLTLSGTPSPTLIANFANGGVKITGVDSGATGYVVNNIATTSGTKITVIKTSGRFSNGEKITASDSAETSSIVEDSSNTDLTLASVGGSNADDTRTFEQVRSMVMVDASAAAQNFTADLIQETPQRRANIINNLTLDGTDAGGANANNTFTQDVGDDDPSGGIIMENPLIPRLVNPEKNNALEKLPKSVVKTLLTTNNSGASDTQYTVRRQFIGTTNASGIVTFNASTNETFVSHIEKDYVMSILTAGGGTGTVGQLVSIADTESGTGTASLTITDSTVLGSAAKVKLTATILKTSVTQKNKTTKLMKQMKVTTGTTDAYGTRPTDRDISLGRADAFKLVGVFDSQDTSTDAVAPTLTLTTITGTFTRGEKITGGTSGATGRIISTSSPMSFVSTNSFSFTAETITGTSSEATATVTATTDGDITITSKYLLDTGQRDNYYDIARIVRKRNQAAPIGRLLVVYDYLEHGAGDMFTVDSYNDIAKQMEYDDIPIYTASKIDVDEAEPSGKFPLYDCYDFRPRVDDITGASATLSTVDEITGQSFNFYSRTFGGTGGTTVDTPKPGSFIQSDFEYYLPKFASLILTNQGDFKTIEGRSAENPLLPKVPDNCMLIATMFIPAYTFLPRNVSIRKVKHQRYTMKDIGKIAKRLDHVEYYTALSLLERDAESFEVTDANGLNRFKSGFVVDNFKGHRIGDTVHRDYKNSMDFELGQLRPKHKAKAINLIESVSTDAARTVAGYQKTGDLITLPYTEVTLTEQPYATRTEKIRPIITHQWMGNIILSPESDTWFETEIIPELVINEEGDFDAVLAQEANNLGSIWNSWQTQWSGVVETRTDNWTEGGTQFSPDRFDVTRTTETVRTDQTRTGVNTQVALRIDRESQGFRVVSTTAIPIVRSRSITFTGENFKPNTRLYSFFNKTDVTSYVTPASTDYTTVDTPIAESPLVTTATGKVEGTFLIPDPNVDGNPRFNTGDIEFRLTSSDHNGVVTTEQRPGTAGSAIYSAIGMLETEQETIIATRNATVTRTDVTQETSFNTIATNDVRRFEGNWNDEQAAAAAAQAAAAAAARPTRTNQVQNVWRGPGPGVCFIAGTQIMMHDHTQKNIEDVQVGEKLHRFDGESNEVLTLQNNMTTGGRKLGSINGGDYFFTEDHPLKTPDGWKSINAEMSNSKYDFDEIGQLQIGDTITGHAGDDTVITSIETKEVPEDTPIYNFTLDGDHEYFANDFLVHNKGCFLPGTPMTMEDHTTKNVEDIEVGDRVHGEGGNINTVQKLLYPFTDGRRVVSINGGDYFTTEDHPLLTTDGWKSCNGEMSQERYPSLNPGQLEVGDEIKSHLDKVIKVESIDLKKVPHDTPLHNFTLDGDHTYIANDYVMHNKGDDPLAQTFMMEGDASGSGRFITSVDLYHQAKDDVLPVTVEIRNVVNGFPGPKVLPFGRVVKNPADINISDTAATATTYTFSSPVYVEAETEYCIVVMTNSDSHKIWVSRMGETDVGSERTISEQPHVGVLYKSGNNRGWSMSPMEDAKFTVKAAEFSTTAGVLALTNDDVPTQTLGTDPLIITDASTTMKINHPNHHMYATTNNVTISGVKSPATTTLNGAINSTTTTLTLTSGTNFDDTSGIYSKLANNLWYIKIDDEILTYTTISTNAISGLSRAVDGTTAAEHVSGATVELYQAHKVPFTEINKTHTSIANPEIDSYTLTLSTTPVVDGSTTAQSSIGGTVVKATENAIMDVFSTLIGIMEMPGTSLAAEALVVRATSPSGSQTSFANTRDDELVPTIKFPLNDNYKFEVPYMVCSAINETNELSSLRSFETQITMKTETPRISPIIDLGRTSMIAVANRINNIDSSSDVYPTSGHVGSLAAEGDENAAIYITKQVTLDNLATGIKLLFAAHRPSTNDIKVMYKILPVDESEDFDNLGYTYFNSDGSPDATVSASASINDFHEYEYTAGVSSEGVGNPLQDFISFQIKIIMQGTNCAEPPRLKALRAIALGT